MAVILRVSAVVSNSAALQGNGLGQFSLFTEPLLQLLHNEWGETISNIGKQTTINSQQETDSNQ